MSCNFFTKLKFCQVNKPYDHGVELTFENFIDKIFDKKHL